MRGREREGEGEEGRERRGGRGGEEVSRKRTHVPGRFMYGCSLALTSSYVRKAW